MYALGRFLMEAISRSDRGQVWVRYGPVRQPVRGTRRHPEPKPNLWHVTVVYRGHMHTVTNPVIIYALREACEFLVKATHGDRLPS